MAKELELDLVDGDDRGYQLLNVLLRPTFLDSLIILTFLNFYLLVSKRSTSPPKQCGLALLHKPDDDDGDDGKGKGYAYDDKFLFLDFQIVYYFKI